MRDAALRVAPGSGLLSRRQRALLFTVAPNSELVDAFTRAPEGGELQALASATVAAGFDVGPFVALAWDGGLRVMAFGDVAVETDQPSLPMLSGAGSRTWVEHGVAGAERAVVEVSGGATEAATDLQAGTVLAGGFRLEVGVADAPPTAEGPAASVAAGTAADATSSVPRMEHTAVLPAPERDVGPPVAHAPIPAEPLTDGSSEPVDVDPDDPAAALAAIQAAAVGPDGQPLDAAGASPNPPATASRAEPPATQDARSATEQGGSHDAPDSQDPDVTLPPPVSDALLSDVRREAADGRGSLVDAKLCANGHANPPTAATCAVCAEFLAPGAAAIVHVPRPSLGRLQLDDGQLIDLEQELLIGRNPDRDGDPLRTALRRVRTLGDKVSRSHLEVRFQGWDVLVADCGSTNGTFVVPHPGGQVVALEPGRPQMIDAGAVVYFGSRSFTLLGRGGPA